MRTKLALVVAQALLVAGLALSAVAGAALADAPPYPKEKKGSGSEPLAAAGAFAGTPYRARSAIVEWDTFLKGLNLYVFQSRVTCAGLVAAASTGRVVHFVLDQPDGPKSVPIGSSARGWFVEFETHPAKGGVKIAEAKLGVKVVVTRVESSTGGIWHGKLSVPRTVVGGKPYSFAGTFSASWCPSP